MSDSEILVNASRLRELQAQWKEHRAKRKAARETLDALDREGTRINEQIDRVRRLLLTSVGDEEVDP